MYYSEYGLYIYEKSKIVFDLFNGDIYTLNEAYFCNLFQLLNENFCQDKNIENELRNLFTKKNQINQIVPKIKDVKINVTNLCNLKCTYCYANHGNYGEMNDIMTLETAEKICHFIKKKFGETLERITFFGGEPLLNIDIIEYICNFFYDKGITYYTITNLTCFNSKVKEVLSKYNIYTTVSLDGPKNIHDYCRMHKDGKGTYEEVINNIDKIRKTSFFRGIEATYTKYTQNEYNKEELLSFLNGRTDVRYAVIADVDTNNPALQLDKKIDTNENSIKENVDKAINSIMDDSKTILVDDIYSAILGLFTKKEKVTFCGSGIYSITIDSTGQIWPCQAYIGKKDYIIADINQEKFVYNEKILNKIKKFNYYDIKCKNCVARYWCGKCAIGNDDKLQNCQISNEKCKRNQIITEKVIFKMIGLMERGEFEKFNERLIEV